MASSSFADCILQCKVVNKQTISDENRQFDEEWTVEYFVIPQFKPAGSICLICNESIAMNKEYNVKLHFTSKNNEYNVKI